MKVKAKVRRNINRCCCGGNNEDRLEGLDRRRKCRSALRNQNGQNAQQTNGAEPPEISCDTCNSPGALAEGSRCNECNAFSEWRN